MNFKSIDNVRFMHDIKHNTLDRIVILWKYLFLETKSRIQQTVTFCYYFSQIRDMKGVYKPLSLFRIHSG